MHHSSQWLTFPDLGLKPHICLFLFLYLAITQTNIDIANETLGNKWQWWLNQNTNIFYQEKSFENAVCKLSTILYRPIHVELNSQRNASFACTDRQVHKLPLIVWIIGTMPLSWTFYSDDTDHVLSIHWLDIPLIIERQWCSRDYHACKSTACVLTVILRIQQLDRNHRDINLATSSVFFFFSGYSCPCAYFGVKDLRSP